MPSVLYWEPFSLCSRECGLKMGTGKKGALPCAFWDAALDLKWHLAGLLWAQLVACVLLLAQTHVHPETSFGQGKKKWNSSSPSILILACPLLSWGRVMKNKSSTEKQKGAGGGKTEKGRVKWPVEGTKRNQKLPKLEVLSAFTACTGGPIPSLWETTTSESRTRTHMVWN